jgi:hypothetical protein
MPSSMNHSSFQMFALPAGFRPAETWLFGAHVLLITGSVFNAASNPLPLGATISLDGISFRAPRQAPTAARSSRSHSPV